MTSFGRVGLIGLPLVAGASLLAGAAQAQDAVYVPVAPPAPRVEVVPAAPPDRVTIETWQPGYWRWDGMQYVWIQGRYIATPRRGAVWIPGRWEHRAQGWVYIDGHWG